MHRIADVIAEHEPDVVCLQERMSAAPAPGWVDQADAIAQRLAMSVQFHPAMKVEAELYGDAILTHRPERLVRAAAYLPCPASRGWSRAAPCGRRSISTAWSSIS